jgi:Kef-type K+ transport system membrane component KefB/Trk K+ transport system NAD-binding subunit
MAEEIFIQLALILIIAFITAYIVRSFKQPIIIGYIIAGIIISPFIIHFGASQDIINVFSEFGIAFLLFIVGLHLNPKVIKEIGAVSFVVGLVQVILTFGIGLLAGMYILGWGFIASVYVGIALAFSSTIIIMKLLSDKRQLDSLYGKISIGILILQDFIAIAALMFISSFSGGNEFGSSFGLQNLLVGIGVILFLFFAGFFILPRLIRTVAKSQELLFLFSITWAFAIAALFIYLGFSLEIGALIAGIVLSISPYSTEISSKIRPLRDFFLIIFFIILGLNVPLANFNSIIFNAIILSLIVLIFKPLILMVVMAMMGYTKRTNFLVGTTLAQISEFSLIVLGLGAAVGHIGAEVLHTLTLTAIITITLSTYLMIYSNQFYKVMSNVISIFEAKKIRKQTRQHKKYNAILFGYNRIGFSILNALKKIRRNYLVVDFNPDIIANLEKHRIPALYGDPYDVDLLEELPLDKIQLAVSTIPDFEINQLLIEHIRSVNPKALIIVRAHSIENAFELYKKGASYVLTPHFLGGEYVGKMIEDFKVEEKQYEKERTKHIKMLEERMGKGQKHPDVEAD